MAPWKFAWSWGKKGVGSCQSQHVFFSLWYKSCSCAVFFSRGWGSFPHPESPSHYIAKQVYRLDLPITLLGWCWKKLLFDNVSIGSCYVIRHPLHCYGCWRFWSGPFCCCVSGNPGPMQISTTQDCHRWRQGFLTRPGLVFCTGPLRALYICIYPFARSDCFWGSDGHSWIIPFFGKKLAGKWWREEFHRVSKPALARFGKVLLAKQQAWNLVFCCWLWLVYRGRVFLYWARKKAV